VNAREREAARVGFDDSEGRPVTLPSSNPFRRAMELRDPPAGRWDSPLDMAVALMPTTRRTPALTRIDAELKDVADGTTEKLMVFVPPQEGKSTLISCWYVFWQLVSDPTLRIGIVSYSQGKARRWGRWIRGMIKAHPELGVFLAQDSRAVDRFETTAGGLVICAGIESGITGESLDHLLIDDPVRGRAEAESQTYRDAAWEWWESSASTRASSRFRAVIMQTRWHSDDLAGRLLRKEPGEWRVLRIPAIKVDSLGDIVGTDGASAYHPNGELISVQNRRRGWFLELQRKRSGYVWRSIYMQDPTSAEGNLFKRPDFRYWYSMPRDPTRDGPSHGRRLELVSDAGHQQIIYLDDCWRFITVDLAASKKTSADWSVAAVWAITPNGDLILLDRARKQIEESNHFGMVGPLAREWAAPDVFVEKGFIGSTLVIDATRAGIRVQPVSPETDKVTRALPATNRVAAHRAWFPAEVEWLDEWCDELAEFPSGRHDDQADVFAYAARISAANWLPWDVTRTPGQPPPPPGPAEAAYEAMTGQGTDTQVDFDSVQW
jgi:predicted phage terminase large subunit-like protein